MPNDTDSSTSSSSTSADYKRTTSKKHKPKKKHKSQKKSKHSKDKKRTKLEAKECSVAAPLPRQPKFVAEADTKSFGPALPPHLQQKTTTTAETKPTTIIGPTMPKDFLTTRSEQNQEPKKDVEADYDDDDDIMHGPMPTGSEMNANQLEREQRALEIKIAALERDQPTTQQKVREEWMLELPDVGLRTGLASLPNMKRTFYAGKEKPDFSDRSSWTKTPQSESGNSQQPSTSKANTETLKSKAEALYERERDAEQERIAKKHKKKHKREESLVELHQKKLRKEQRKKEKELAASGAKPERRPFSRDVDLKLNKIDSNQTKQIVDKAKILDSKFSLGRTKYL